MKFLSSILFFFLPFVCVAQDFQLRKKIDSIVSKIDKQPIEISSFSKPVKASSNKSSELRYHFKSNRSNFDYIRREFKTKDSMVTQTFYSVSSILVYAEESIVYYYGRDSIGWSGIYYFSNGKLVDYQTLGHGKSELDYWDPDTEALINYRHAKADISAFLQKKDRH